MTGISWATIEDALAAWVIAGTGLTNAAIVWSGDNSPRPAKPYVEIAHTLGKRVAQAELTKTPNAGASPNDLDYKYSAPRILHVTLQAFSDAATGSLTPTALLEGVCADLEKRSRLDALKTADIGVLELGAVSRVGSVINSTRFEPRAILEIRCLVTSEVSETGGYFDTIRVTNQIPDPDDVFDITE